MPWSKSGQYLFKEQISLEMSVDTTLPDFNDWNRGWSIDGDLNMENTEGCTDKFYLNYIDQGVIDISEQWCDASWAMAYEVVFTNVGQNILNGFGKNLNWI